ncbi:MAG: hypothetical protein IT376_05965 [Polyangiaceae bacterium]|nr:hypothetical protein [Polyangiaceae bacterium]
MRSAAVFVAASVVLVAGCGTGTPEIPPELLQQPDASGSGYPGGPYGLQAGVLENLTFPGWRDPVEAAFDPASLETLAFADFYDPSGASGARLLLVNTAAVWCLACKVEHEELPALVEERRAAGLRAISLLFQDASGKPASADNLAGWGETFETNFPLGLDADFLLEPYAGSNAQPLNLFVDPRTMQILRYWYGDQRSEIWPWVDARLAAP